MRSSAVHRRSRILPWKVLGFFDARLPFEMIETLPKGVGTNIVWTLCLLMYTCIHMHACIHTCIHTYRQTRMHTQELLVRVRAQSHEALDPAGCR